MSNPPAPPQQPPPQQTAPQQPPSQQTAPQQTTQQTQAPTQAPSKSDPLKSASFEKISSVQTTFEAAVENGLVGGKVDQQKIAGCQKLIAEALDHYSKQEYDKALDKAREADTSLSELIQGRGLSWRLLNLYAAPWFAVLVVWFVLLVWIGYSVSLVNLHSYAMTIWVFSFNIPKMLRLVILTAIAGGLGAILRQGYYASLDVKMRKFKRSESIDIVMAPFLGFLFGFLAFLVIAAGLLVATQKATGSSSILNLAVGFLLGFSWKEARDYIHTVTTSVLGGSTSTTSTTRQPAQGSSPSG